MKFLLTTLASLASCAIFSQSNSCGVKTYDASEMAQLEANISSIMPATADVTCNTIRVVVHVIYNSNAGTFEGSGEITKEQVLSQIRITNQFFRNDSLMFDENNVPLGYELVLADTDPQGNPTDGVLYHDGVELFGEDWAEYGLRHNDDNAIPENDIANELAWGEDINGIKYINTYVVHKIDGNSGSGTQAYAYFPTPNVVFGNYNLYNAFGAEQLEDEYGQNFDLKSYTDLGFTWTHEILHNFAVLHTFTGNSCAPETNSMMQGDKVSDTPPQTQGYGCSGSCGFVSYNVMDYLSQSCKNLITQGQADRASLAISFSLSDYIYCASEPIVCEKTADFNDDGVINIIDLSLFSIAFGCADSDPCFDEIYDMNCDGIINIQDVSLMLASF